MDSEGEQPMLKLLSYAYRERKHLASRFALGEGLVGQCALEKERILLTEVPCRLHQDQLGPGRGDAAQHRGAAGGVRRRGQGGDRAGVVPSVQRDPPDLPRSADREHRDCAQHHRRQHAHRGAAEAIAIAGRGAARPAAGADRDQQAAGAAGALAAGSEELLKQQREQLQQTNEELEEKAELLSRQNMEVERKNVKIELARRAIEEKAEQLALTSKYKSEFLANMSHELRTPLNSLLILSRLLSENADGNLTPKQIEFATTIHASGADLLMLINDILDLAKIESGTMTVDADDVPFADLRTSLEQTFAQIARDKGLEFEIDLDAELPQTISTDSKRLQQVLKNLLSNAFKFTGQGNVTLRIARLTAAGIASTRA